MVAHNTIDTPTSTPTQEDSKDTTFIERHEQDQRRLSTKVRQTLHSIQRYIWDDPDKPREQKWFLFKLDLFLLTAACLGYFSKNLDQSNIKNAYVSGMQESLNMHGSELTYAGNVFTAGYVVGQLPAVMLATRIRPSILIPTLEIGWSVLTFCSAVVTNVSHLYTIRFFVGVCESGYFPVMMYLVGSWYTSTERGKRVALFYCTAALAGMFSGYLQAAAYSGLDGVNGMEGWRWLFIICGVISLPVAFLGYWFIPDFPETTRAFYITPEEAQQQCKRLREEGQKPLGHNPWTRSKFLKIMKQWQFWVLPLGYFFVQSSHPVHQPAMALWLKSTGHSVYERNVWPTGQVAVGVVVQLAAGALSDSPLLKGRRWPAIIAMQAGGLFGCAIIAAWNVPDSLRFVAYYLSYCTAGVPGPYFSFYSDLIPHDHEMRGFLIAASNTFSYIMVIWYELAVWRTIDQPKFTAGFTAAAVLGGAMIILTLILRLLLKRDNRRREKEEYGPDDVETVVSTDAALQSMEGVRTQESEVVEKHGAVAGKV